MKKLSLLSLLFSLSLGITLQAQEAMPNRGCGTPPEKSEWLIKYQQNPDVYPKSDEILYVPITVHLVGTNAGTGYFKLRDLFEVICILNDDFAASDIQFFLEGNINYINNTAYYDHEGYGPGADMMQQYNVPNTINCYIVDNPAGACGYYNGWGVALKKSCTQVVDHTWAHEIGHYLSLPHPFLGWQSVQNPDYSNPAPPLLGIGNPVEKVDGSNCHFAADGFCDTDPDYLADRWDCNGNNMSATVQIDPNGVSFRSDGTLFMSYANDACSNRFSDEQIAAMRANLLDDRPYLLYNQNPGNLIEDAAFSAVSPEQGEQLPGNSNIYLEWEAVPGATGYLVYVNPLPSFAGSIFHTYLTDETSFTLTTELLENRIYFWKVVPFNPIHTCPEFPGFSTFYTGSQVTGSSELKELNSFRILPNPAASGQEIQLRVQANQSFDAAVNLLDVTGKVLMSWEEKILAGDNQLDLPLMALPAGLYLVGLESENGRQYEKLVVSQ